MSDRPDPSRRALLGGVAAGVAATMTGVPLAAQAQAQPSGQATPPGPARDRTVIRDAQIVSMDPAIGDHARADILIEAGVIAAVGPDLQAGDAEVVDARGMLALPGFVDAHWHMWNSVARNAAPTAKGEKFFEVGARLSKRMTPEMAALAVRISAAEAIHTGVTTLNNWAHNIRGEAWAKAEIDAMRASGLRGRFWYGYPQDLAADQTMAFAQAQKTIEAYASASDQLDFGIALRGPERTPEAVWRREFEFAREANLPVSTHIGVTRAAQKKKGVMALADAGYLTDKTQLVHATHCDDEDIARIKTSGASVCLTPWTEMRVGYGLPPVMRLVRAGVPISAAIDTLVLGGRADFFSIMQLLLNLGTGMSEDELALTPRQVVHWATQGGADTVGWGAQIGSLSPGKQADLILIDGDALGMTPLVDPYAAIVNSATPHDVKLVMARGVVHKRNGQRVNDPQALARALRSALAKTPLFDQ